MTVASLRSIAVRYGAERRDNDWYRVHAPEAVARSQERGLAKAFATTDGNDASRAFDERMRPFLTDPFRGARVRYRLGPGETVLDLELAAAREALEAAGCTGADVDLLLCASWLPEDFMAPGDAVFLARDLGMTGPAYNIESACSSGLVCMEVAEGLLASGRYRRILVVLSNTNSRQTGPQNTLGWISTDVAAAAVLERATDDIGILSTAVENTADSAGVFVHRMEPTDDEVRVQMRVGEVSSAALRASGNPDRIRRLCLAALDRAHLRTDEVDYFGFSTPLAWFWSLCTDAVAIDRARSTDLFPRIANAGLPFPLIHLHHAMAEGRLRPGGSALLYTQGSTSSAGALVLRVGDVALGRHPNP